MYRYLGLLLLVVSFSSCCRLNTEVYYKYNGVTIKRVDKCGETTFYYHQGNGEVIPGKIWAKYSGINDGFSGYLRFSTSGKVELLSGDGYFQMADIDSAKFSYKSIIATERPKLGKGVYYISLSTKNEIEKNKNSDSQVKVKYKIDENEWR